MIAACVFQLWKIASPVTPMRIHKGPLVTTAPATSYVMRATWIVWWLSLEDTWELVGCFMLEQHRMPGIVTCWYSGGNPCTTRYF